MQGTWMSHALIAGDGLADLGWYFNQFFISNSGYATCQLFENSSGTASCQSMQGMPTFDVTNGIITSAQIPTWHGVLNISSTISVSTLTDGAGNGNIAIGLKMGSGFSVQDLQGTWRMFVLASGDAGTSGWAISTQQINNTGTMTCLDYLNDEGDNTCAGHFDNPTQFNLSGQGILTPNGALDVHGIVSLDKKIVALTLSDGSGAYDLAVMIKTGSGFSAADATGTWITHMLVTGDAPQFTGWGYMTHTVDNLGNWTCQEYANSGGEINCNGRDFNGVTISNAGVVNAGSGGLMSLTKNVIVYTFNDGGGGYGLAIAVKR